jgi:hypothetical protein
MRKARSARLSLLLCVLGLLLPLAPSPTVAAPTRASRPMFAEPPGGWYNLPYFYAIYGWFRVNTNDATFGGYGAATLYSKSGETTGNTPEETSGILLEPIWATHCKKKDAQRVEFNRVVWLPGEPSKLKGSVFRYTSSSDKNPIDSIILKINGTRVIEYGDNENVPDYDKRKLVDLGRYVDLFRYGKNEITIVGHKKATKYPDSTSGTYCNFGAAAELYGEFTSDTSTTVPPQAGSTTGLILSATYKNKGPTDLMPEAGGFVLGVTTDVATVTHVIGGVDSSGNPVPGMECTNDYAISNGHGDGQETICKFLNRLRPGESVTFKVLVGFSGFDCPGDKAYYFYNGTGYFEKDSTTADNGKMDREIVCSSGG